MFTNNLSSEDLIFLEEWYSPIAHLEVLFHDFNNFTAYKKGKYGNVRLYQYPMISDESLIDFELTAKYHNLNKKEEFKLRKNVGDIYCFGGRKYGKSLAIHSLDMLKHMLTKDDGDKILFASADLNHLKQVLDPLKTAFGSHPILKLFVNRLKGAPDFYFELKNNVLLQSINFNLGSTSPGRQFLGKHTFRLLIEEASMETDEVYDKRKDSLSEFGAVIRSSGMCDFTPYSPPGKAFYKLDNQKFVLNLPQMVNPFWDEEEKQNRIEEYGGEDSISYKVYVKGEVVEDGVSALDMKRIRDNCYLVDRKGNFTKKIKRFEISKENFRFWKNLIVVERPENVDKIYIASDVGKRVTELVIIADTNKNYEYIYNIVLYNLTQQEVETIFRHIIQKIGADIIAIDCGDGEGRGIYSNFELEFPKDRLVYYDGSMKIKVGYEYEEDANGDKQIKIENGEPVYKYELMADFSVQHLKNLLYNGKCRIPEDFKFDVQFSKVIETVLAGKVKYKCISTQGDHLFDAWKVWSIAQFSKDHFEELEEKDFTDWGGAGAVS